MALYRCIGSNVSVDKRVFGVSWNGSSSPIFSRTDDATDFTNPIPYYAGMTSSPSSPFDNNR